MRLSIITFVICFFSINAFSQNDKNTSEIKAKDGTFELISNHSKFHEVLTTDVLYIIEKNRHKNRLIVIKVGKYTYARILSKEVISSPNFKPVSSDIMYIDEEILEIK